MHKRFMAYGVSQRCFTGCCAVLNRFRVRSSRVVIGLASKLPKLAELVHEHKSGAGTLQAVSVQGP